MRLCILCLDIFYFFFFKQKTAYEMRISDCSSDVCLIVIVDIRAGAVVDDHDLGIVVLVIAGVVVGIHKQILLLSWPTAAAVVLNWRSSAKLSRGLRCA